MKATQWIMALALCLVSVSAATQDVAIEPAPGEDQIDEPTVEESDAFPWEEYDKLIDSKKSIATLGPTLFGDQVSLANGALSFSQTDVSLPGNSGLPVAITRTFTVSNRKGTWNNAPMADWDLDLPRISGVYAPDWPDHRCSVSSVGEAQPPSVTLGASPAAAFFTAEDYWQGVRADMPGGGDMLLANSSTQQPTTGGPYFWMTNALTYFACLPTIRNSTGEGFVAITSDGVKYTFDWLAQYREPELKDAKHPNLVLTRRRNVLYATRVEDRFGNWVNYTYTNAPNVAARLTAIDANDGRHLSLTYNVNGHIETVSNGTQTWGYQYSYPTITTGTLTKVTLPDASHWDLGFASLSRARIGYERGVPGEATRNCQELGTIISPPSFTGTITHPSGAEGSFTVAPTRHGRSNVPMVCVNYDQLNNFGDDFAYYPMAYDAFSLTEKTLSGPGLTAATWTYAYASDQFFAPGTGPTCTSGNCGAPVCLDDGCAGASVTVVTGPDDWTSYTHGNSYRYNEGLLLKVVRGSGPTAILNTQITSYELAQSGQPYPTPIGHGIQPRNDGFTSEYLRPQHRTVIEQDGASFTWQVDACGTTKCFDALARPTRVRKFSSLGFSKSEITSLADNTALWVLGQVASVTDVATGKKTSETSYDGRAQPETIKSFGLLQQTLTYNGDGTVRTVVDGNGHLTTVVGWKRGIPLQIVFADNSTRSAVVDDLGQIASTTDELGNVTSYTYDTMGRLASVSLPGWTPTSFSFVPVASIEFGLPAGHWRHTETTGPYKKTTYFDGRFRPLLTLEEDTAATATKRYTTRAFDHDNRETFASYPEANATSVTGLIRGTRSTYDALGRVKVTTQDSELGALTTSTVYLPGFQTRTTNPRGQSTTVSFQAYDTPDNSAAVSILGPDGVSTTIQRDGFGMPVSVTRSGLYAGLPVSATRSYVYDAFERLCKRIEPESGATLFEYDNVGNLIGSAEGQALPSLSCNAIPLAARTTRSYLCPCQSQTCLEGDRVKGAQPGVGA